MFLSRKLATIKSVILRKQPFAIKSLISDKSVVLNNNSYISENIVLKHTSAKFDLVMYKNVVVTFLWEILLNTFDLLWSCTSNFGINMAFSANAAQF